MPDPTIHRRRWWILAVLIVSLFTVNLDNTILNVALPTLARDLHAGTSQLQWMVDAYVLLFAGLLLASGALGDRFGRRRVMLVGLAIFGTGSLASAFAPSAEALILLRAAMGVGGALIVPSTLSVTANVFTMEERPKAIGIWTGVSGLGIVAGPVLAGWLLEHFAWGSIFLINVPVVLISVVGTLAIVPEGRSPGAAKLDVPGTALSIGGLIALVYGVIEAPANGWTSPFELVTFAVAALLLVGFVIRELSTTEPLLDVRLLAQPTFGAAVLAVMLTSFGLFGSMFFFSQYLQGVLGFGTMETGYSILPLAIAMAIFSPSGMVVAKRLGTRSTVAAGMATVSIGLLVLRLAGTHDGYPFVAVTLFLVGGGMGFALSPLTVIMIRALPRSKQGVASAINSTARELGGALGVAILGSLSAPVYAAGVRPATALLPGDAGKAVHDSLAGAEVVASYLPAAQGEALLAMARSAFVDGMGVAVTVGAVVALVGAVVAFAFLPGRGTVQTAASEPAVGRAAPAMTSGLSEAA
ncbi:MAG: DHA2 family efflux MFS transporter permease subunit [Candidatus Limnocylindrales bacterium]|jgi:EmrB/QacA subfamily drug resistance transporter